MAYINFWVSAADGTPVKQGVCLDIDFDAQAGEGETVYAGRPPATFTPELGSGYAFERFKNYPSLEEQLDALWHAMDDGTIPKADAFYDRIKAVKDAYPKV